MVLDFVTRQQRPAQQTTGPVVSRPQAPADWKLVAWLNPLDPPGVIEIQMGRGKGSGGRGRAPLSDDQYTDALRRFANALLLYARDYDNAAAGFGPPNLADDEDEIPCGPVLAPVSLLRPCLDCGALSPWPRCSACEPL